MRVGQARRQKAALALNDEGVVRHGHGGAGPDGGDAAAAREHGPARLDALAIHANQIHVHESDRRLFRRGRGRLPGRRLKHHPEDEKSPDDDRTGHESEYEEPKRNVHSNSFSLAQPRRLTGSSVPASSTAT